MDVPPAPSLAITTDGASPLPTPAERFAALPVPPTFDASLPWSANLYFNLTDTTGGFGINLVLLDTDTQSVLLQIIISPTSYSIEVQTATDDQTTTLDAPPPSPFNVTISYDGAGTITASIVGGPTVSTAFVPVPINALNVDLQQDDPADFLALTALQLTQP